MLCLACSEPTRGPLCSACEASLRPAPELYLAGVGLVRAAYRHRGAARLLVHHLKYRGVVAAGQLLAEAMSAHIPEGAVLVPVARVGWRHLRYGVDPAQELARRLGELTGSRVVPALQAPFWGKARAGGVHGSAPRFRGGGLNSPVLLVDDVITSGATLIAAADLFPRVKGAVTATTSATASRVRAPSAGWTSLAGGRPQRELKTWR